MPSSTNNTSTGEASVEFPFFEPIDSSRLSPASHSRSISWSKMDSDNTHVRRRTSSSSVLKSLSKRISIPSFHSHNHSSDGHHHQESSGDVSSVSGSAHRRGTPSPPPSPPTHKHHTHLLSVPSFHLHLHHHHDHDDDEASSTTPPRPKPKSSFSISRILHTHSHSETSSQTEWDEDGAEMPGVNRSFEVLSRPKRVIQPIPADWQGHLDDRIIDPAGNKGQTDAHVNDGDLEGSLAMGSADEKVLKSLHSEDVTREVKGDSADVSNSPVLSYTSSLTMTEVEEVITGGERKQKVESVELSFPASANIDPNADRTAKDEINAQKETTNTTSKSESSSSEPLASSTSSSPSSVRSGPTSSHTEQDDDNVFYPFLLHELAFPFLSGTQPLSFFLRAEFWQTAGRDFFGVLKMQAQRRIRWLPVLIWYGFVFRR